MTLLETIRLLDAPYVVWLPTAEVNKLRHQFRRRWWHVFTAVTDIGSAWLVSYDFRKYQLIGKHRVRELPKIATDSEIDACLAGVGV